ncbi:MAG TPA: pyridoxal-phosphate dependent enzyme [Anaerolineaceae bacterium]|nr:pyridoxal-phosphate dependent enzyme [Anaerolineaceae bacterium]
MPTICCTLCQTPYPDQGLPFRCPACGGVFDFDGPPQVDLSKIEPSLPGLWRYRHSFDLPAGAAPVSLGEGGTPLLWQGVHGQTVGLKLESLNPTGSYKDRGSAVLLSQLLARGARRAVEDSSGNAGASFAAYAAQAGLPARVYAPESASGPKRDQIEQYGAELIAVPGPRSAAAQAVLLEAEQGVPYASHAYLPFGLAGIATIAYELWEELGRTAPGTVIAPVGHGGLLLGVVRGFAALLRAGLIAQLPYYVGVQAAACAPLVLAARQGAAALENAPEGPTIAEGVRVRCPVRGAALLAEIPPQQGCFMGVAEERILPAFQELAWRGIYVEPTAALGWAALTADLEKLPAPIIVILTGLGLKYRPR